ncbi:hypothetical protein [Neptunicella sp. SCSIO 80796]|uniref:hypothetical protein n=1 Tax=Neptunicella plasticusilytica TaxID=3117012 RepID=UPI003A4D4C02
MSLIPKMDVDNNVVGHIPNRDSKNPVIGVFRCDCGDVATVHNPKGKRSGHYYSICSCGTDQRSGEHRQKWLRENMRETVEDLEPISISEPVKDVVSIPLETAENAVSTVNEPDMQIEQLEQTTEAENIPVSEPEPPQPEAAENAVSTVNEPAPENSKIKPILFAVLGALAGGLLGMA